MSRAVLGGTHSPSSRALGAAQTRGSPPRCGVGYAALPLFC